MTDARNVTFDEIEVGSTTAITRPVTESEVAAMALLSGDIGAWHRGLPASQAVGAEAILSALLNRRLPGPGTRILAQDLRFAGVVRVGPPITASVTVREKRREGCVVVFDCSVSQENQSLVVGSVTVEAPTSRITYDESDTPELFARRSDAFAGLLHRCQGLAPVPCAVVHPCDRDSLVGALDAAGRGLIDPVLVGPEAKIRAVAGAAGADLAGVAIVSTEHSHAAAEKAVALARDGAVRALMKGSLHTDELMGAVVPSSTGLRTSRRISHVFALDVPAYPRMLLVTDAAINIAPGLEDKVDIAQNAIDLAHVLGIDAPRVAILSAVETVTPKLQSTLDAAALCKMADRGQITGGVLDGPLAFDNAISPEAARAKNIASPVAGCADILLVPDLEAGNMLAKQLQYLAGAESAGIVMGTRVPIVLTSRADSVRSRIASTAIMVLVAAARGATARAAGAR